jgi:urease accessory protein
MTRAVTVVRKPAVKQDRLVDAVLLDRQGRSRRHAHLSTEKGLSFTLDLEMETVLNDGDALRLDDGRLVQVKAAAEELLEVRAENPIRLMRLAWHLGSQHGLVEITADAIYIENDPALAELARNQGCITTPVSRAFKPEVTAHHCDHDHHGHGHHHGHDHGHKHHDHGHKHHDHHDHDHKHAHHDHEHGPACGCGHDHKH